MKRTKLIASLLTCVMCLSFLAVGVWAAVAVNFGFGANLQFTPEGVFVELSGQVYRGDSASTLEPLTSDSRFTLETQTNFDNSSSEPSGNFPLSAWDIDNLAFTPVDRFIEIRVTIKNHSAFTITATPTAKLNSQDIASSTFTNFTVTDNRTESGIIDSGQTKTYSLLIELNEGSTAFTGNALSVSFTFDQISASYYLEWVADDPGTTTANDGYWTLTMGEYQGTPLKWRMVLKENEEGTDVSSVANYTKNTTLSGSYYFLLDTYKANVFVCSFENNFTNSGSYPRLDEYKSTVNVNDYAVSNIREYLTGTDVYRRSTSSGSDRIPAKATGQTEPENFLDVFNITSSPVYSLIEGRSLSDLYLRMGGSTSGAAVTFDADVKDGVETKGVAGIDPDTTKDKLWLLSYYEAYKITGSTGVDSGARSWDITYWLRSPYSSTTYNVCRVDASGRIGNSNNAYFTNCARPAFKISIN